MYACKAKLMDAYASLTPAFSGEKTSFLLAEKKNDNTGNLKLAMARRRQKLFWRKGQTANPQKKSSNNTGN